MPQKIKIPIKTNVADLSTKHVTREDARLLEECGVPDQIGKYDYGYVVRTIGGQKPNALLIHGMSQAYVNLLQQLYRRNIHYLFLDQDGEIVDGIRHFDW